MSNKIGVSYNPAETPPPHVNRGMVVYCTNRNTSEFTKGVGYRVEYTLGRADGSAVLAMVRNDNGELRVVTALAWALRHWELETTYLLMARAGDPQRLSRIPNTIRV